VAVDNATGTVAAAIIGGWSCSGPGPTQFDGSYSLNHLAVGPSRSYQIYAEPLRGAVTLGDILFTSTEICRNSLGDPGWPTEFACTIPVPAPPFSARVRPGQ